MRKDIAWLKFNLDGGLDTTSNYEYSMDVSKLTVAQNIELGYPKYFKKRKGKSLLGISTAAKVPMGLYEYVTSAGTRYAITADSSGYIFRMDSLDGTWDEINEAAHTYSTTTTDRWQFTTFEGKVYATEGTNFISGIASTDFAAVAGSPPAGVKYVCPKWGFLFAGNATNNNSMLYYSAYRNGASWNTTTWILPIAVDDNTEIKGLVDGKSRFYVFKDKSVYSVAWVNKDTSAPIFPIQKVLDVGTVSQKTIKNTPFGIVWFDGEHVYLWNETDYPTVISGDIADDIRASNYAKMYLATAMWYPQLNQYWLSIPYSTDSTNSRTYVCSFVDGKWKWAMYDYGVGDLALLQVSGVNVPYGASASADGKTYRLNYANIDVSSNISAKAKSKWFSPKDFGIDTPEAILECMRVVVTADGNWDVRVGYEKDFDTGFYAYPVNQYAGGDLIGSTFIIGVSLIGGGNTDVTHERWFKGVNFKHIRFCFENNMANQPFSIKSIEVGVRPKRR